MNKKIFLILLPIISFGFFNINAQKNSTDSLEKIVINYKKLDTNKVNLLNETAYKLYQINVNKTLKYAKLSGELAEKLNFQKGKSESIRLIGIYNILKGNYSAAMDNFQQSLKIATKINNKAQVSKAYNNIGLVYSFYEDHKKELEYYKKALIIDKQLKNKQGISICYSNIGLTYITLGDYQNSLKYLNMALKISEELEDKPGISRINNNIGSVYSIKKNYKKAFSFLNKSIEISSKIGTKSTEAESYKDIGHIFLKQNNYKKAYLYSKKAYLIAKDFEEAELLKESAEILAKSSSKLGLFKEAYKYQVIYKTMNDSLYNDENQKKIASIEYQYKYEQEKNILRAEQQKKDLILAAEKKHQKTIKNSFIFGFISMLLLSIILYINFLQKRTANKVLSLKKKEIEETNFELIQTNDKLNSSLKTVNTQKEEIERNHKSIQDSINYASRIQQALLPAEKFFSENFNSHFMLYKPKDIVSGDFYYFKKIKNHIIVAAADCTGHGVPGAFVSMLGIAFLNEIVRKKEIKSASQILEELRNEVKITLKDNKSKDGMDIALCVINTENNTLQFSGANNPLYIFRNKKLIEIKGTINPIGTYYKNEIDFKNNKIKLIKGDTIYMFSDGYPDQFGGEKDKKFMLKRFQSLLMSVQDETLNQQKEKLDNAIENWKGEENNQTDDILVLGIEI